jgi:hypothetical protein
MSTGTEQESPTRRWWQWPRVWARDESFWRAIVINAVSNSVVVFIGLVSALALQIIKTPNNFAVTFQVFVGMMLVVVALIWEAKFPFKALRLWLTVKSRLRFPRSFAGVYARSTSLILGLICLVAASVVGFLILKLLFNFYAALVGIDARV